MPISGAVKLLPDVTKVRRIDLAVVLAHQEEEGRTRVYALPIPTLVKARLGLDGDRSWISVDEANVFYWPGPDLRFLPRDGPKSAVYGFLPPGFFRVVRDRFIATDRAKKAGVVKRTE